MADKIASKSSFRIDGFPLYSIANEVVLISQLLYETEDEDAFALSVSDSLHLNEKWSNVRF